MGAVGEEDTLVLNERVIRAAHISEAELAESVHRARAQPVHRLRAATHRARHASGYTAKG